MGTGTANTNDNDCVESVHTGNNECDDNDCGGGGHDITPPVCEFKRGVCKQHNVRGKKEIIENKTWEKVKFGYGWRTNRRVHF